MNRNILILLSGIAILTSCVKGINNPTTSSLAAVAGGGTTGGSGSGGTSSTTLDPIKDSVYLYSKENYFWADVIPGTFNPRNFTGSSDIAALQNEINAISQLKINTATNLPYEYVSTSVGTAKYFYIDGGQTTLRLNATSGDFGIGRKYNNNIATDLRVAYVNPGSPADLAGVIRGSQITSVNGSTSLNFDGAAGANVTAINNAFAGSTLTLGVTKPDGTKATYNLTAFSYPTNPVLRSSVISLSNGQKAGYLVFNSFVAPAIAKTALDAAFLKFQSAGVIELVVDLRYNGGGYTETAQYLLNLLAPANASNGVMFTANYNTTLQTGKEVLLKQQVRADVNTGQLFNYSQVDYSLTGQTFKFAAVHPLNLSRIFFLVTNATASSSELTINALKPYMNVQLVGATTFGKPIGFIDIKINKYTMFVPAFEIRNSLGDASYYTGMIPASTAFAGFATKDDLTHDFGDSNEGMLSTVINYINTGIYKTNASSSAVQSIGDNSFGVQYLNEANIALDNDRFKGMIFQSPKHH